jgi:hypothetical protein
MRQHDRRTRRKINLYVTLKKNGLAPDKSEWNSWISIKPFVDRVVGIRYCFLQKTISFSLSKSVTQSYGKQPLTGL